MISSISKTIDRVVGIFSPKWAAERAAYRNAFEIASTQYAGAARSPARGEWNLGLGTATPPKMERNALISRTRDANRNDAIALSINDTMSINISGNGLKPQSKLRADRLGISEQEAENLRQQAEDAFGLWKPNADAANRLTFDEIQFLALAKIIEDGESICVPTFADDSWRKLGLCLEIIESERLEFPAGNGRKTPANETNDSGIELGKRGEPVKYWIKKAGIKEYAEITPRDDEGRPNILHLYRTKRAGQLRGVPLLAPVLTLLKDLGQTIEASVVRARVSACLAVIMTKSNPAASMLGAVNPSVQDKTNPKDRIQDLYPGMILYNEHGDKVDTLDPTPFGEGMDPFLNALIRLIGACAGLPYELVLKDFSKTNYSSARAALLEGRRVFMNWRKWFAGKFCDPIYRLVLEEAFLRGMFRAPRFYENIDEYCRAIWIGDGWGWVDPTKEIEAAIMAIENNISTYESEIGAQGGDWEETFAQRQREVSRAKERGLTITDRRSSRKPANEEPANATA